MFKDVGILRVFYFMRWRQKCIP